MYNMGKDTYTCDLCGFEMKWDNTDADHGDMWGCEKCGATFCSKCFIERHGRKAYMDMMQGSDLMMYLLEQNMDTIIEEARKGREA